MSQIQAMFAALLVVAFIVAIYVAILKIIFKLFEYLYRWLRKKTWFKKWKLKLQDKLHQWIKRFTYPIQAFWGIIEILIEPAFYGFTIAAIYDKFQTINQYIRVNPQYDIWSVLDIDMITNIGFWITFLFVFSIWFSIRAKTMYEDKRYKKKTIQYLEIIAEELGHSKKKDVGHINKQIFERLQEINEYQKRGGKK